MIKSSSQGDKKTVLPVGDIEFSADLSGTNQIARKVVTNTSHVIKAPFTLHSIYWHGTTKVGYSYYSHPRSVFVLLARARIRLGTGTHFNRANILSAM